MRNRCSASFTTATRQSRAQALPRSEACVFSTLPTGVSYDGVGSSAVCAKSPSQFILDVEWKSEADLGLELSGKVPRMVSEAGFADITILARPRSDVDISPPVKYRRSHRLGYLCRSRAKSASASLLTACSSLLRLASLRGSAARSRCTSSWTIVSSRSFRISRKERL